jgi:hypothetical protein
MKMTILRFCANTAKDKLYLKYTILKLCVNNMHSLFRATFAQYLLKLSAGNVLNEILISFIMQYLVVYQNGDVYD